MTLQYSSPIWAQLSTALFGEDTPQNQYWLWVIWMHKQKVVRDQLQLAMASSTLPRTSVPKLLEPSDIMENHGKLFHNNVASGYFEVKNYMDFPVN